MSTDDSEVDKDCWAARLSASPTPGALDTLVSEVEPEWSVVLRSSSERTATPTRLSATLTMENPASGLSVASAPSRRPTRPPHAVVDARPTASASSIHRATLSASRLRAGTLAPVDPARAVRPVTRLGCWLTGPLEGDDDHPVFERIALLAEAAERAGFDSFWVTDTPPPGGPEAGSAGHGGLEAYSLLGALATRTQTMRLGAVPLGPSAGGRPPSMVVKIVTGIDVISHGRGIVTFAMASNGDRGGDEGSDGDVRRVAEALRVGRTMLEDEAPTFAGSIYTVDRAFNRPGPVQKGGVPLVVVAPVSGDAVDRLASAPDGAMASSPVRRAAEGPTPSSSGPVSTPCAPWSPTSPAQCPEPTRRPDPRAPKCSGWWWRPGRARPEIPAVWSMPAGWRTWCGPSEAPGPEAAWSWSTWPPAQRTWRASARPRPRPVSVGRSPVPRPAVGARSVLGLHDDLVGVDAVLDPDLAGPAHGVGVEVEVLLGQRVDVGVGSLLGPLHRAPDDDDVVGIVRIDDGHGHVGVLLEIGRLGPAPWRC